jgi:hypothetical protein
MREDKKRNSTSVGVGSGLTCFIVLSAPLLFDYFVLWMMTYPDYWKWSIKLSIGLVIILVISIFFGYSILIKSRTLIIISSLLVLSGIAFWIYNFITGDITLW